jgi:hypothetical protein
VFAENRFHLGSLQLSDLSGQGVDPISGPFHDKGNDVDSFVPQGNSLAPEDDVRIVREKGIDPCDTRFAFEQDEDTTESLFYRTTPLDQNSFRDVEKDEIRFSVTESLVHAGCQGKDFVKNITKKEY